MYYVASSSSNPTSPPTTETPGYYQQVGLIERSVDVYGKEVNLNLLFAKALRIVAFLPFALMLEKYRWAKKFVPTVQ